ncbi:fungalysin metallopeptidase [Plectosphaerella plurivora]|uniref:Extracellular metalloproteinase n=1 Tax=Plectosphaerella plurivora TaxID=936078 RepID=A0A9P9AEY7_9PEZI|nr:fungalysin metallopeptidase [Plectosphaerella plurivora]
MSFFKALALASLLAPGSRVMAHPASHQPSLARRGIDIEAFRLPLLSEYTNATETVSDPVMTLSKRDTYVETATELVKATLPGVTFRVVSDHYVGTNGVAHVNFKQTVHGIDIDNADFNVNIGRDGEIFSSGNSFYTGEIPEEKPLTKRDFNDPVVALQKASEILNLPVDATEASAEAKDENAEIYTLTGTSGAVSDPVAKLVYFQRDGALVLTWRVETDIMDNWLLTYIDAKTGEDIHGVVDYVSDLATYNVYPWGVNDPSEGSRQLVTDPWNSRASEFAYHSDGTANYTTTRGNNAIAQTNPSGGTAYLTNYRPTRPNLDFDFAFSLTQTTPSAYADASITQLFYTSNVYHDVLYLLGFTEAAGNFETNNNGQGGRGADFVILNTQDGSGTNNANFATPADGQPGRMRMYIWDRSTIRRDSSFEAGVVIHEYTHGLSNRLTGGPANAGCLSSLESGGMGEGWGDFMATAIRLKATDTRATDYAMGSWVYNSAAGIRPVKYSTSLTTNPYTYTTVNSQTAVHAIGTTWATMLYEVMWNLIDKYGKSTAVYPTFNSAGVPTDGKFLAMKLVVDGMALQPCNPTFVSARDAIIDADRILTGGANRCALWTAFAKRGLGSGAVYSSTRRTASTVIPAGAC